MSYVESYTSKSTNLIEMLLQFFICKIDAELFEAIRKRMDQLQENIKNLTRECTSDHYLLNLKLSNPYISRTPINDLEFGSCPIELLIFSTSLQERFEKERRRIKNDKYIHMLTPQISF